jgi:general secretion pathway protein D
LPVTPAHLDSRLIRSGHATPRTRLLAAALAAAAIAAPAWARQTTAKPIGQEDKKPAINQQGNAAQPVPGVSQPQPAPGAGGTIVPPTRHLPPADPDSDTVTLSAFTEPVELGALVEYVADALNINIAVTSGLSGTVVFNAPVTVKKSELINLLDTLLEQVNFTIVQDRTGLYTVRPIGDVPPNFVGDRPTTKVIQTPNAKPTSIKLAIDTLMGPGQGGGAGKIAYIDDLGVIIITDTPRRIAAVQDLVDHILAEQSKMQFIRVELHHVAAPVARTRAIELLGQGNPAGTPQIPGQPIQGGGAPGQSLSNFADRITVDPGGNALIFRGQREEVETVRAVLAAIDVINALAPVRYTTGSATRDIAKFATMRGLGEQVQIEGTGTEGQPGQPTNPALNILQQAQQGLQNQNRATTGGPVLVVDEARGQIVYYGTPEQHAQLRTLVDQFRVQDEAIVIREYKLRNADADTVADLLRGLLTNEQRTGNGASPLLPGGRQGAGRTNPSGTGRGSTGSSSSRFGNTGTSSGTGTGKTSSSFNLTGGGGGGETGVALTGNDNIFVLSDPSNNQVLVKAPVKYQSDVQQLIAKLDLRRPQVYLEAKIVAVTATQDFRLAFETQLINAGGLGGVVNTNFGLGSLTNTSGTTTTGGFLSQKQVAPGLSGFTGALIKSQYVPIVINALQNNTDTRILSTPQILVDDNEEAGISSVDKQPTTQSSVSTSTTLQSFGGYEEAGTTLTVKPTISEGGYLRLKYETKLSSFTGTGTNGIPPPKQENTVSADSVTVPSDMTVVIGGLILSSKSKTIIKVPLLGDIPLIGQLFRDDNRNDRQTTLYVFLTPRILRDPTFADLRLLTKGPQASSHLPDDLPPLKAAAIEIFPPPAMGMRSGEGGAGEGASGWHDDEQSAEPGRVRRRGTDGTTE